MKGCPRSVVFGGNDRQTLFIAARSSLYAVRTKCKAVTSSPPASGSSHDCSDSSQICFTFVDSGAEKRRESNVCGNDATGTNLPTGASNFSTATTQTTEEQIMKGQVMFVRGERQRGERLAFVGLGIAGLAMILFAVSAMFDLAAGRDQVATALSDQQSVAGTESTTVTPLAVSSPGDRPERVIDSPAQTTNATAVCSPRAAITIGDGARIVRPARAGFAGPRARLAGFVDF